MTTVETLQHWLAAINHHNVDALTALMTEDIVFTDSLGNRVKGASSLEQGWRSYFTLCPDYWVRGDQVMTEGDTLLVSGEAGGTIDGVSWKIPAAWRAIIRDGRVAEWQVFADNTPVYKILAKRRRATHSEEHVA